MDLNPQDIPKFIISENPAFVTEMWPNSLPDDENDNSENITNLQEVVITPPISETSLETAEILQNEMKEEILSEHPTSMPSISRPKPGSVSETAVNQELFAIPTLKSAITEKPFVSSSALGKPDVNIQDAEIWGFVKTKTEVTKKPIEDILLTYHVFPVTFDLPIIGNSDLVDQTVDEKTASKIIFTKYEDQPTGAQAADMLNESLISLPSKKTSATSFVSEEKKIDSQETVDTYMHYVYGGEISPRSNKPEDDEASQQSSNLTFVVKGEELLPRFDFTESVYQTPKPCNVMGKKTSEISLSSMTTNISTDLENESKDYLILDLSIDETKTDKFSALSYRPVEDNAHSSEFAGDSARSAISEPVITRVPKRRSLQRLYQKTKMIRSTPRKMKKFFCFTVSFTIHSIKLRT